MKKLLKINLGSRNTKFSGFVNVDCFKQRGVDVVANLNKGLPFDDNSVVEILCFDLLEHLDDPINFLKECNRVLVRGGVLRIHVPHYKDGGAYRPQHKHYFSYTWFSRGLFEEFIDVGKWKIKKLKLSYKKGMVTPLDWLANIYPQMWERLFWVTSIDVELIKI